MGQVTLELLDFFLKMDLIKEQSGHFVEDLFALRHA